ncbi:uncharacterized protein LOC109809499 [Cajanus cajan]|uniref:uncharacterized protein LOC109809499 n=1 Tax=Cajanus cajan TaxID=3821 RepID=UPI00098DBE03|nr:uncharacterized protein LOC109809499 [Cajanus cajan]
MTERIWGMPVESQPPSEPPDGGVGGLKLGQSMTFKEKVLGTPAMRPAVRDLIKEGAMTLEFEGGDRLFPKFSITAPTLKQLCAPWEKCLVIKLLGREVGFLTLRDRLPALWKAQGGLELLDVSHGYYMVKFDLEADRERVMHGGPWMLFDHYLIVRPWSPDFVASATKVDSTLVWVRFSGLGVMFYDESVLLTIASAIGKPVKVDLNTLNMTRGRFARVCVEIDLNVPVVGRFFLNGVWYNVEYEGLHLLCSACGCYGHVLRNCTHANKTAVLVYGEGVKEATEQPSGDLPRNVESAAVSGEKSAPQIRGEIPLDPHGEWLVVKRRNRRQNPGKPLNKDHAFGDKYVDGGHGLIQGAFGMGPTLERKKRSRGEGVVVRPRPTVFAPALGSSRAHNPHASIPLKAHVAGPNLVQVGSPGSPAVSMAQCVLQPGSTTKVSHVSEDDDNESLGTAEGMQYEEEEVMVA